MRSTGSIGDGARIPKPHPMYLPSDSMMKGPSGLPSRCDAMLTGCDAMLRGCDAMLTLSPVWHDRLIAM